MYTTSFTVLSFKKPLPCVGFRAAYTCLLTQMGRKGQPWKILFLLKAAWHDLRGLAFIWLTFSRVRHLELCKCMTIFAILNPSLCIGLFLTWSGHSLFVFNNCRASRSVGRTMNSEDRENRVSLFTSTANLACYDTCLSSPLAVLLSF